MNKKLISLLLALMMLVCMGAVGLAAETCANGHTWELYSFAPNRETSCVEFCGATCGNIHDPDHMEPNVPCPGCGFKCEDLTGHYFKSGTTSCYLCGYECVDHEWEIDPNYSDRYYCTVCNVRCQDEEGNTAHKMVMNQETGEGACSACPFTCDHTSDYGYTQFSAMEDGISMQCYNCDMICKDHVYVFMDGEYQDYYECKFCTYSCTHYGDFDEDGKCVTCGSPHVHDYAWSQACGVCGKVCEHTGLEDKVCDICQSEIDPDTKYVISFVPGIETQETMTSVELMAGSDYMIPACGFTAPEGYTFEGWKISSDTYGYVWLPGEAYGNITGNVTLTAQWKTAGLCTVSFDLNGYGSIDAMTVMTGSTITLPAPSGLQLPGGTNFDGWLVDGEILDPGAEITVQDSMVVQANWSVQKFTLKLYASMDATTPSYTESNYEYGNTIVLPNEDELQYVGIYPPTENDVFYCWMKQVPNPEGGTMFIEMYPDEGGNYGTCKSDMVFAVNWLDTTSGSYTLTVNMGEGVVVDPEGQELKTFTDTVYAGKAFELPPVYAITPPAGLFFSHFVVYETGAEPTTGSRKEAGATISAEKNLTADAVYDVAENIDITIIYFDPAGQTEHRVQTHPGEHTLPDCMFDAPAEDMFFVGWHSPMYDETIPAGEKLSIIQKITFNAEWRKGTPTKITYHASNGTDAIKEQTAYIGAQTKIAENTFVLPGFHFAGWEDAAEEPYEEGDLVILKDELDLYACWEPNEPFRTLTFEPNNNLDAAVPMSGAPNGIEWALIGPDDEELDFQTPEGHVFDGWNTKADGQGTAYAIGDVLTIDADITLYAQWKANSYTFTLVPGEGDGDDKDPETHDYGYTFELPGAGVVGYEKNGYDLVGWNDGTKTYKVGESYTLKGDVTLTAQWERKTYTVTIDLNGMTGNYLPVEVKHGDMYTMPEPDGIDYPESMSFSGWKVGDRKYSQGQQIEITGNITVVAQWTERKVSLTYVNDAGDMLKKFADLAYGTQHKTLTLDELNADLADSQKLTAPEGYEFGGWLLLNTANGVIGEAVAGEKTPIFSNWLMKASWVKKSVVYTLTLDMNGGDALDGHDAYEGGYFELPPMERINHPDGLEFDYFDIGDGNQYGPHDYIPATGNITAKAIWKGTPTPVTYTITFDANGGAGTMADVTVNAGDDYTFPECGFTAPEGKMFDSWYYSYEGLDDYEPGFTVVDIHMGFTLKAIWKDIPAAACVVTFDANHGTGSMAPVTVEAGSEYTLPECSFTRSMMRFKAWNYQGQEYAPGQKITVIEDAKVSVVWQQVCVISFNGAGAEGEMASVTVDMGSQYILPECSFTKEGHTFAGWTEEECLKPGTSITVNTDTSLVAVWDRNPCVITFNPGEGTGEVKKYDMHYGDGVNLLEPSVHGFTYEGHECIGWTDGTNTYDIGTYLDIEKDVTYTALWKKLSYTITFEGEAGSMDSVVKEHGDTYALPECGFQAPINNEFKAWDVNGTEYKAGDTITVTGPVTVKPVWNWIEYTVTFDTQGGTGTMEPVKVLAGTDFTVPVCSFEAPEFMLFSAWVVDDEDHAGTYKPGDVFTVFGNVTLKASWTQTERKITYKSSDAADAQIYEDPIVGGQAYTLLNNMFTAPEGKMFRCWLFPVPPTFTEVEELDPGTPFPRVGSDLTFIADWETLQYTVSFDSNGGSGSMEIEVLEHGSEFTIPECGFTAPTGMVFDGWKIDGEYEMKGDSLIIKGSVELTAQWVPMTLAVNFEAGEYGSGSMETDEAKYGVAYTLPYCGFSYDSANYVFIGWNLNGTYYSPNDTVTLKADTTFTAMWADRWYTFSYVDSNDTNRTNVKTYRVEYGETHTMPTVEALGFTPKKEFHEFDAWMRTSDEQLFAPGATFKNKNMTFKAMWKFKEVVAETESLETVNQQETNPDKLPEQVGKMLDQMQKATANADPSKGEVKIETVQDIVDIMTLKIISDNSDGEYLEENIAIADVIPVIELEDGTKIEVRDPADYPDPRGVEVPLPIPAGTSPATHDYKILHMLTEDCEIGKAGDVEELVPHRFNEQNMYVWMYYFSPVATAYKEKPVEVIIPDNVMEDLPQTGDPSSLLGWITLLGASGMGLKAIKRRKK